MTSKKVDLKPLRNAVLQIEKILQELVETGDRMQVDDFMRAKKTCFIEAKRVSLDIASQSTNKDFETVLLKKRNKYNELYTNFTTILNKFNKWCQSTDLGLTASTQDLSVSSSSFVHDPSNSSCAQCVPFSPLSPSSEQSAVALHGQSQAVHNSAELLVWDDQSPVGQTITSTRQFGESSELIDLDASSLSQQQQQQQQQQLLDEDGELSCTTASILLPRNVEQSQSSSSAWKYVGIAAIVGAGVGLVVAAPIGAAVAGATIVKSGLLGVLGGAVSGSSIAAVSYLKKKDTKKKQ